MLDTARLVLLGLALALTTLAIVSLASLALADGDGGTDASPGGGDPDALARLAVDPDAEVAEPAIAALRILGPTGHAALLRVHAPRIAGLRDAPPLSPDPAAQRLRHAVDVVSGQRDGHASGLYWYTDLGAARAEAERTGRPILSLRLLGRLDEELSCANSRYFRVVLYPNEAVSRLLSERFVLHWSSERPVPRVTIDMGDGRRIETTLTGNSVHYVLDGQGRVVDALPGLYSPAQFVHALEESRETFARCRAADAAFSTCTRDAHRQRLAQLETRWTATGRTMPVAWRGLPAATAPRAEGPVPSAVEAMPLTVSKAAVEMPLARALDRRAPPELPRIDWRYVAGDEAARASLDARSITLLRLKTGRADVDAMARTLAESAATDGVRNAFTMRRTIHEWLAEDEAPTFEALNARVYAEMFLTPASDPWLGLGTGDLWTAIEAPR
jgi:hypothetical protein